MTLKWDVEENVSEGLDNLQAQFEQDLERTLKELMISMTGRDGDTLAPIPKRLMHVPKESRFNPWLFKSGQDQSRWVFEQDNGQSSIEANYSGMEYKNHMEEDDFKVWIEFSDEFIEEGADMNAYNYVKEYYSQYELHLNRDYAFYQETGVDKYADPEDAHHKHFVQEGVEEASERLIPEVLRSQLYQILKRAK